MNGWIEKNEKVMKQIQNKLQTLPDIFTDFCVDMQGDGKSNSTIKNYIDYVSHFMYFISGTATPQNDFYKYVKSVDIKKYIISLSTIAKNNVTQKTSDDYQALRWSAINTFFNFLMVNDYIKTNPMLKTKRPKINTEHHVTYLNRDEIAIVMKSINKNYTGHMLTRDKAIIGLALSTGLRVSAIVQINLEDIDFDNGKIHVIEKRMKTRDIEIGENAQQLLKDWIETRNKYYNDVNTNALFLSQKRQRISTNGVRELVTKYTKDINKHITPHKMRSTMACNALAAGIPIIAIKNQLGHDSIVSTQRYLDSMDKDKINLIQFSDKLI